MWVASRASFGCIAHQVPNFASGFARCQRSPLRPALSYVFLLWYTLDLEKIVWLSRCQSFSKMICHCLRTSSPTFSQGPDLFSTLYILAFLERFTCVGWFLISRLNDRRWIMVGQNLGFCVFFSHVILLFCWPAQRWFVLCFILFIWPMDLTGCQKVVLHFACIECCWINMDLWNFMYDFALVWVS